MVSLRLWWQLSSPPSLPPLCPSEAQACWGLGLFCAFDLDTVHGLTWGPDYMSHETYNAAHSAHLALGVMLAAGLHAGARSYHDRMAPCGPAPGVPLDKLCWGPSLQVPSWDLSEVYSEARKSRRGWLD